jgi:hypothetical protein
VRSSISASGTATPGRTGSSSGTNVTGSQLAARLRAAKPVRVDGVQATEEL